MVDIRQERAFEIRCDATDIKKRLEVWAEKSNFTRTLDSDKSWEFKRGTHFQASYTFDVRNIPTTVRVEASGTDSLSVRCTFHVKSTLNIETSGDKKKVSEQFDLLEAHLKAALG